MMALQGDVVNELVYDIAHTFVRRASIDTQERPLCSRYSQLSFKPLGSPLRPVVVEICLPTGERWVASSITVADKLIYDTVHNFAHRVLVAAERSACTALLCPTASYRLSLHDNRFDQVLGDTPTQEGTTNLFSLRGVVGAYQARQ